MSVRDRILDALLVTYLVLGIVTFVLVIAATVLRVVYGS